MTFQTNHRNMQFVGWSVFVQFMWLFWHYTLGCAEPLCAEPLSSHIILLCFCLPVLEPNRYFSHVTASLKYWLLWWGFLPLDAMETVIIELTAQQCTRRGIEKKSFNIINNCTVFVWKGFVGTLISVISLQQMLNNIIPQKGMLYHPLHRRMAHIFPNNSHHKMSLGVICL